MPSARMKAPAGYKAEYRYRRSSGNDALRGPMTNEPMPTPIISSDDLGDDMSGLAAAPNGTGAFRGVYLQGNVMVGPIFKAWMAPFADKGGHHGDAKQHRRHRPPVI